MKLKEVTRKTKPMSLEERLLRLNQIQRGWINYFKLASIQQKLLKMDGWLRIEAQRKSRTQKIDNCELNRIRYCIWHDWKKLERKRKNLIRLGVAQGQAYAWSRTRMGGWAVAQL